MTEFHLAPQLQQDCFTLGKLGESLLLLFNNSLVPWFILVPPAQTAELFELDAMSRLQLVQETDALAAWVKTAFDCDKINVASIGNLVSQLHVHVVGRRRDDYCWPGVVWGRPEREVYTDQAVMEIVAALSANLGDRFELLDH